MPEPIRIPLSVHQQARFAAFQQEAAEVSARIQQRVNDTLTGIVAGHVDPTSLAGWAIEIHGSEIVCTPPQSEQLTLVQEAG